MGFMGGGGGKDCEDQQMPVETGKILSVRL